MNDSLTPYVIALCAIGNIVIAATQVFVIPFLRAVRGDLKELNNSVTKQEITLARIQQTDEAAAAAANKSEARYHELANTVHLLLMHLAAKGIFVPESISREQKFSSQEK